MRYTWIGALVLGMLPAMASAGHRDSVSLSFGLGGFGIGFSHGYGSYGYRGYDRGYNYCYAPSAYYRTSWYNPAPVYCPPTVIYERPAVVYSPPPQVVYVQPDNYQPAYSQPAVVYSQPPAYYAPVVRYSPPVQYAPAGQGYYYSETRYYYGR